ncbi:MAG: alanine racemase, partial [Ignavibacteriaceae bacterium]|nr:alanine racemase [Ignavibacteriaceae bacterium]
KNHNIRIGNEVVLMGKQKGKEISVWEWAERIGTIPYEITCNISQRVPRIYLR